MSANQVEISALSEITDWKEKITDFQDEYLKIETRVTEMEGEIKAIMEKKGKQMSSDFKLLSELVDKLSKELVKVGLAMNNQKDSIEVESATVIQNTLHELEKGIAERNDAMRQFEEDASTFT